MVTQGVRPTVVHVRFTKPVSLDEVGSKESGAIHQIVIHRMRKLIENPPSDQGTSAL